jgi:dipeptidyl aminopeptidase/acylaminoacyl peptidase
MKLRFLICLLSLTALAQAASFTLELLIHGDDDRNVPFNQTVDLVQRLRAQKVEFEELIFPDEIHGFLLWRSWIKAYRAETEFFNRKLK